MDLLQKTKKLCAQYKIKPARSKGQNFLITEKVFDRIVESAELKKDDIVLEVGPGLGFLTEKLSKKAKRVIAVELDDKLAVILRERLEQQGIKNVEVINEDVLNFSIFNFQFSINEKIHKLKNSGFKIVANLPYNITSYFLRKFLSAEIKPELMILMLQKEVAQRIVASPPNMSLLAVSVQFYADPKIIQTVKAGSFWPKPEVDSAIISLRVASRKSKVENEEDFFKLIKAGFSSKRKMLKNNLAKVYNFSQKSIEEILLNSKLTLTARAQELSLDNWLEIFGNIYKKVV